MDWEACSHHYEASALPANARSPPNQNSTAEWREDLKALYRAAGGANARPTAFLLDESQIKFESFLEDVNNALTSGEVPNLFPKARWGRAGLFQRSCWSVWNPCGLLVVNFQFCWVFEAAPCSPSATTRSN